MKKIESIKFNNYRSFFEDNKEIILDGKNLLVWGENGSGKTSFCKAIIDFVFDKKNDAHQRNIFSSSTEWNVTFRLDSKNFVFDSTASINDELIKNCAVVSPFLDYRKILSLYYSDSQSMQELNLLKLFETLLSEYPIVEKEGIKLKELKTDQDYKGIILNILNHELKSEIKSILKSFKLNFEINSFSFIERKSKLIVKTEIHNTVIKERFHDFLNEARLSALSISVYLAAIKKLFSLQTNCLKILVLDDMLIGLDMGNRLAVFDILKKHFNNCQVFFFTYDKAWFDVFKNRVKKDEWIFLEMYAQSVKEGNKIFEKPFIRIQKDCWLKLNETYENFDYEQCGNLLRKELEKQLDNYLCLDKLEHKISLANIKAREKRIVKATNALISKIDSAKEKIMDQPLLGLITALESIMKDIKNYEQSNDFAYLKEIKDDILNPASHNQNLKPYYKKEIEYALESIMKLKSVK